MKFIKNGISLLKMFHNKITFQIFITTPKLYIYIFAPLPSLLTYKYNTLSKPNHTNETQTVNMSSIIYIYISPSPLTFNL